MLGACYNFSFGAGACLNPALGLAQSTYMIGIQNAINSNNRYADVFWVYTLAPFVGAILAAVANVFHLSTTEGVEEEMKTQHLRKLSESRSIDKIDVEDTRSDQSSEE